MFRDRVSMCTHGGNVLPKANRRDEFDALVKQYME